MELQNILNTMVLAEQNAGRKMLEAEDVCVHQKSGRRDVVTEYDVLVQKILVEAIQEQMGDAHFFCEESAHPDSLNAEHVFVIDPIDGTMNFAHGLKASCISCAYLFRGEPAAAAVYNPYLNEQFTAIRGRGAFRNGDRISAVTGGMGEGIACVGTSPYYPEETDRTFCVMRLLYDRCLDIRRSGSAVLDLCSVASGRSCIYYEGKLSFWDFAAGSLIAEEAGAVIYTPEGTKIPTDGSKSGIVCGSAQAVKEFFDAEQGILS